jgi:hypothetical protein
VQSVGRVGNKAVSLCPPLKQNTSPSQVLFLMQIIHDLQEGEQMDSMTLFEDNQTCIGITKNPKYHGRAKHISFGIMLGVVP